MAADERFAELGGVTPSETDGMAPAPVRNALFEGIPRERALFLFRAVPAPRVPGAVGEA